MSDSRLQIDKYQLDKALVENPSFVQEVGDELAEAIAIRDTLKEKLETVDAELDGKVRDELEKSSKRATETIVAAAIKLHPDHKSAFEAYNEAKLKAARATALDKAVSTRSDALRLLADLYKSGYFAINSARETPTTREVEYEMMRTRLANSRSAKLK